MIQIKNNKKVKVNRLLAIKYLYKLKATCFSIQRLSIQSVGRRMMMKSHSKRLIAILISRISSLTTK